MIKKNNKELIIINRRKELLEKLKGFKIREYISLIILFL